MSAVLQTVIERWAEVVKENDEHKSLVVEEQRKQWEDFESKTTARLKAIIEAYDGKLSQTDTDYLRNLQRTIDHAERVDRETLEARKAQREEAARKKAEEDRLRKEAEERKKREIQETKAGLLSKLGF